MIEGHNLFQVRPAISRRARPQSESELDWGRSGGFLRLRPSRLQIAEKTIDLTLNSSVDGRHSVEIYLLAQFYDVGMQPPLRL